MAEEYVDLMNVSLESASAGLVQLKDVKSVRVRTRREVKRVSTMNRQRKSRGFRRGNKEVEVELSTELAETPEVDWYGIYDAAEIFQLYGERSGGERRWLEDCTISDIEEEEDDEGESSLSITIMALENIALT